MKSRNFVFTAPKTVEVQEHTLGEMGPGQMLVRAEHSLVSTGTELICLNGEFEPGSHWDNWVKYPFSPGYNHIGIVEAVGEGVERFKVGDRVATRSNHKEFVLADAGANSRAVLVPGGVAPDDAAWFGMACIAQIGVRRAAHELGDAIVIVGAGLLGQLVTQYVRLMGAREIIMIDTAEKRLELAREHGATHTLAMGVAQAREAVNELTEGRGADVVYDVTGHPAVFREALKLPRRFGKLLLLGDAAKPGEQRLTADVVTRGVQIVGAHDTMPPGQSNEFYFWSHTEMTRLFFTYLQRGQMRVGDMVTHRFKPDEAPQAYAQLLRDRSTALGVIFDW